MKNRKKIVLRIVPLFIILSIICFLIIKPSESSATDIELELRGTKEISLKKGEIINVEIYLTGGEFTYFDGYLKYDTEVFELLDRNEDIVINPELRNWNLGYNEDDIEFFSISRSSGYTTCNGLLATIKFTVKADAKKTEIRIEDAYECDDDYNELYFEEPSSIEFIDNSIEIPDIPDIPVIDNLYLSTEKYKIGNNDIKNYENGDKYISRVVKNTTKEEYISNLETNGTIRILKEDGTELGENELVGTGMRIEVTKEEEKIELQIAVMGDLSGDGEVTAQDLSRIKDVLLEKDELKDEYFVAADFDELNEIKTSYLSEINHMCLQ